MDPQTQPVVTPPRLAPATTSLTRLRQALGGWVEGLVPVAALGLALLVGAVLILALGVNPLDAYGSMLQGAVGSVSSLTQTLVKATPLLLVGLGITIAFRGGVINIGGEGQIIVGALTATAVALALPTWPAVVLLPLTLLGGRSGRRGVGRHPRCPQGAARSQRDSEHDYDEPDCGSTLQLPPARPAH